VAFTAYARVGGSISRAVLHGNTPGDALCVVHDVLVNKDLRDLESALAGLRVRLDVEKGAVLDASGVVLASVKSALEEVLGLPAHDEVTVVAVASRVTVRKSELAVLASELVGGPDGLVEEEGVVDIVALGALALLDKVGVGNVGVVVVRVRLAGTAARETDLKTHAVLTVLVHVGLGGELVAVERRLGSTGVVEAVETKGPLGEPLLVIRLLGPGAEGLVGEGAVERTEVLVSGDHLEALGEGLDVVHVVKVVGEKTADLGNHDRGAVAVDEVERGSPVGGLVLGDSAGGASALGGQVGVGRVHGEVLRALLEHVIHVWHDQILTAATSDGVDVVGDLAGVHDGIHTGNTGLRATRHAPESVSAAHESESGGGGGAPHGDGRQRSIRRRKSESRPMGRGVADMGAVKVPCWLREGVVECIKVELLCVINERHDSGYQSRTRRGR